ncbi:MAG: hypothetical protein E7393_01120 [Ruminococcaceae bacterium]|nr:hypothetical protein [Oscillospiraceae bacterium]
MSKTCFLFVDDVIWCLRDLAQQRPASVFDIDYFKMLKKCHDEWGATVQLNLFYRTDFFYGSDEFSLSEVPDAYKAEFEANAHWLKFAFHAKQEFPDYPYVNGTYEFVKKDYMQIVDEIKRFAGEKSLAKYIIPHWLPISKEGCRAFYDCGVEFLGVTRGDAREFTGDESVLPYGHAARLLHNRQKETKLFTRPTKDKRILSSICAYNHVSTAEYDAMQDLNTSMPDEGTGLRFRASSHLCLNLNTVEEIETQVKDLAKRGVPHIVAANHEQYFYKDYFVYQPDMPQKFYTLAKTLHDEGYRFITAEEFK